ncbi:MAG: hypothetical protein ABID04_01975 [Patescibacteria group bacterium]
MISSELKQYPFDFFILGLVFVLALLGFFLFSYNQFLQEMIVLLTGVSYFLWGIFHHWQEGDLCAKIVLEYLFLAVLGVSAIVFVVLRG